jgi:hypothetical protein
MRKSHYLLFGVAIVALGYVAASPGAAQAQDDGAARAIAAQPELTTDQQAEHDRWPTTTQAQYAAWPAETKSYYWSLEPGRRMLFWALADSDKIALTAMAGPEREDAWKRIEERAGSPPGAG